MSRKLSGVLIQHKTGTASQWTSVNPTLAKGEIGFETDTAKMKIGDGITAYNNLPYLQAQAGESVGHIQYQYTVENGYIALDGSEISRSTYLTLWTWCQNNSLTTSDQASNPQLFGIGDGSTTFNVPNFINRVLQGGSSVGRREAGLPNIMGNAGIMIVSNDYYSTGAFLPTPHSGTTTGGPGGSGNRWTHLLFDASNSNKIYGASETVQSPAIILIPQIKY